ncbi:MAG: SIMPL domain-containing protein [Bacteroidales bacterium]|nr:SIMPL domain-containing protein [Bacteroidales bacterium]MBR5782576.1 SIMPL domain-containing protein [Bacteroidales bacterium]
MKNYIIESIIIAAGLFLMGLFLKNGLDGFSNKDRVVNVKGLAEMEVMANKVTWPLMYKQIGNDLNSLYTEIYSNNETILKFLVEKGLNNEEIAVNAPELVDLNADRYSSNKNDYRYIATQVITVTTTNVDLVRRLIQEQSELLKQGIAITGGDYMYNVRYEYTDLNNIKPQMIEEATKNARAAAEKFASDSDSELGKIKRASQGQFSINDRDEFTPYIKKVRVVTTIDYYLED